MDVYNTVCTTAGAVAAVLRQRNRWLYLAAA